jgi:hypothetical protein
MMTRRWLVFAVSAMAASACASTDTSTARQYGLATNYEVGAIYELLNDRLLDRTGTLSGVTRARRPAEGSYVRSLWSRALVPAPASIEDYENNPSQWPSIKGVLRRGAQLRVTRIDYNSPFLTLDAWLDVYAEVLDGPLRGESVDLLLISRRQREGDASAHRVVDVDPSELRQVGG